VFARKFSRVNKPRPLALDSIPFNDLSKLEWCNTEAVCLIKYLYSPCLTLTSLACPRRSFGPRSGHWHVHAPRRVRGRRHTKSDHTNVVRLRARHSRWRHLHDRSRDRDTTSASKRGEQTVHRTAWTLRLAGGHANRESHERGVEYVPCRRSRFLSHVRKLIGAPLRKKLPTSSRSHI